MANLEFRWRFYSAPQGSCLCLAQWISLRHSFRSAGKPVSRQLEIERLFFIEPANIFRGRHRLQDGWRDAHPRHIGEDDAGGLLRVGDDVADKVCGFRRFGGELVNAELRSGKGFARYDTGKDQI